MAHRRPDSVACLCTASGSRLQLFPHPIDLFANHPSPLLCHPQTLPETLFEASRFARPMDAQSKGLRATVASTVDDEVPWPVGETSNSQVRPAAKIATAHRRLVPRTHHMITKYQFAPYLRLRHQHRCLKFISRFHFWLTGMGRLNNGPGPYLRFIPSLYHHGEPVTEHAWIVDKTTRKRRNHHKGYSRSLNRSNYFAPVHLLSI